MSKKVNPEQAEELSAPKQAAPLIWARPERVRQERPALSREQIVRVALEMADTEGIDEISLRRIAARLKVSAMALYWYIERKEDVFELMIDAAYGEVPLPEPGSRDWRSQFQEMAVQIRAMMHRHPWFASLIGHRAILGPNALRQTDSLLGIVSQLGFDMTTSMSILMMFNAYIVGFMLGEMGEAEAQRRIGLSKREWQEHVAPYMREQVIASGRYPHLARYLAESEERLSEERFLFGLTRLLDGIAAYSVPSNPNHER